MRPMRSVAGYSTQRAELTPRMPKTTAYELQLSESTIAKVRAALCARLEAPNITAAVYIAARRGELP